MSNRVEKLEATVSELEATVRGLTEELVETKERLRAVEAELGVDAADFVDGERRPGSDSDAGDEPQDEPSPSDQAADPDGEEPRAEEDKTSEDEEADDAEEPASGDDIIVA